MASARRRIPYDPMPLVLALAALSLNFSADDTPIKMTHVIVRMSGTDIPADSFATKPKVYRRAGSRYCRVDEEPDPDMGIHGRTVINEPDAWLINLADHTARHIVDRGPTFNCRLAGGPSFESPMTGVPRPSRILRRAGIDEACSVRFSRDPRLK
jgi:hypothetical protein